MDEQLFQTDDVKIIEQKKEEGYQVMCLFCDEFYKEDDLVWRYFSGHEYSCCPKCNNYEYLVDL